MVGPVKHLLHQTTMLQAIGLAAIMVVLGIFMPDVLRALQNFLLVFLQRATELLDAVRLQNQQVRAYEPARY